MRRRNPDRLLKSMGRAPLFVEKRRLGKAILQLVFASLWLLPSAECAQPQAPQYEECRLDSVYPNGGQRGTAVRVTFKGHGNGLTGPREIVIDGPPGVVAKELKSIQPGQVEATLEIAADAPLGRRWLRVLNERSGLTNFTHFVVGGLPEHLEVEPNNDLAKPEPVSLPVVVTGRVNPPADLDVFRFTGRAGQKFVAAIAAHSLDVHGQYRDYGIADFSLELRDAGGRTLAAAEDTLGFDPLIEHTLPADGEYLIRVQLLNYGGFAEAIYRLTLGEVPYATAAWPPVFADGTDTKPTLIGPNIVPLRSATTTSLTDPAFPLRFLALQDALSSGLDVPVLSSRTAPALTLAPASVETLEAEPNDQREAATALKWPVTINGRFEQPGDADWYRVSLPAGQKLSIEVTAHRFLRSPVDSLLAVFDASGKLLVENDDEAFDPGYESYHDFKTTDSKLQFVAPAADDYFVRVTEQSGLGSPRAIYRLTLEETRPDFRLTHFPDAVPVWGPGSTACVLVRIDRFAGFDDSVELRVEGLPAGWSASTNTSLGGQGIRPYNTYQLKVFLTLTAPPDAVPGTAVPFRIVGRSVPAAPTSAATSTDAGVTPVSSPVIEHGSLPLTLFYTSDTGFFRASPVSRVAVAKAQGPWLEAMQTEITIAAGGSATIPVRVLGLSDFSDIQNLTEMPTVVNVAMSGVACSLMTPRNLPIKVADDGRSGIIEVPLTVPPETYPGTYGITVAQTWRSDIRIGMPGPCTPLIRLTVTPKP